MLSTDCEDYKCTKYKYNYNLSQLIPNSDKLSLNNKCAANDLTFNMLDNNNNN